MAMKRTGLVLIMIAVVAISVIIAIAGINTLAKKVSVDQGPLNTAGGRDLSITLQETMQAKANP
jgi:hypothetical protein